MRKTYDTLMTEVSANWTEDEQHLSDAARAHFAAVRAEAFELGASLKARREELGLTQRELAERSGIQQSEISRIERERGNPTWSTLRKLSGVLALDVRLASM